MEPAVAGAGRLRRGPTGDAEPNIASAHCEDPSPNKALNTPSAGRARDDREKPYSYMTEATPQPTRTNRHMRAQDTPLHKLRALAGENQRDKIANLVNQLRLEGYPNSILRHFTDHPLGHDDGRHSYTYPQREKNRNLGPISGSPLISIIVVSFNSSRDLARLLPTLRQQSYSNWELIVIENGDEDSRIVVESEIGSFIYLKADNPGFAEANNIGLEHSSGELILLLNPDTELQRETLKELVHAIRVDGSAAAACPKIYFHSPFNKITLDQPQGKQFSVDISSILDKASYKKFFVREGSILSDKAIQSTKDGRVSLDIAIDTSTTDIELIIWLTSNNKDAAEIFIDFEGSGEKRNHFVVSTEREARTVPISRRVHSCSRYLLNNCGSGIRAESQMPFDIGYGEEDYGQYSSRAYPDAFCGCCVLLRRDLFIKRKIFISQFFAYFEDSELSLWIKSNGMNILYVPSSIVYHRHSEKTIENSNTWNLLVRRSSQIYKQVLEGKGVESMVNNWKNGESAESDVPQLLTSRLREYDAQLEGKTPSELIARTTKRCLGIYNSYWSSLGGGEKHALDLASLALQQGHEVYLICEREFSIKKLSNYFDVDLQDAKKLVTSALSESLTERFDIFVNSTFGSNLISRAPLSYYVVSFPHRPVSSRFLASYIFLHNSGYTRRWAERYWGKHSSLIVNPVLGFASWHDSSSDLRIASRFQVKEKILLTVGRFNYQGHCKNQHLIASAFKRLSAEGCISNEWKLIAIGSVDQLDSGSVRHFDEVKGILEKCNAHVIANSPKDDLFDLYKRSAIYVHAAGMMLNPENSPEKFEHFGISVFEAIVNGCIPVVHETGGPADQVSMLEKSFKFSTQKGLETAISEAVRYFEEVDANRLFDNQVAAFNSATRTIKDSISQAKELFSQRSCGGSMIPLSEPNRLDSMNHFAVESG